MKRTPVILGGIAAALMGGAVLGATTNTTPLMQAHEDTLGDIPQHAYAEPAAASYTSPYEDRYPLETADGVVPVQDLDLRGRLRDEVAELEAQQPAYVAPAFEPLPAVDRAADHRRDARILAKIRSGRQTEREPRLTVHPLTGEPLEPVGDEVMEIAASAPVVSESAVEGGARTITIASR